VLDGRLRLPPTSQLATTACDVPTWVVTRVDAKAQRRAALERCGVEILTLPTFPGDQMNIGEVLAALAGRGLTRVLVEGGSKLAAALLRARMVDRLVWFQAPLLIGGDGLPAIADLGLEALAECPRFQPTWAAALAHDAVQVYIVDTG
jgi:diaminohydroxyphosphoribosylaminopyrimidine deaminase / 5-amino-6-(5-phosphoribosylamino)uracil reductase